MNTSENWQRIVEETLKAQITSELMETLFNRRIEQGEYWPRGESYVSFGGVRWKQGIRKGDERLYWEIPTMD